MNKVLIHAILSFNSKEPKKHFSLPKGPEICLRMNIIATDTFSSIGNRMKRMD